jgi:hypothetical protein
MTYKEFIAATSDGRWQDEPRTVLHWYDLPLPFLLLTGRKYGVQGTPAWLLAQ